MSASAFSLTVLIPADGFRVVAGEPVRCGAKQPGLEHYGCPECFTWTFTRVGEPGAYYPFVNVRPMMFDVVAWREPFIETMTSEKVDWVNVPARHSYEGFPPEEEFGKLIEAYAEARSG